MNIFFHLLGAAWFSLGSVYVAYTLLALPAYTFGWNPVPWGMTGAVLAILALFAPTPVLALLGQLKCVGWTHTVVSEWEVKRDGWLHKKFFAGRWAGCCVGLYIWYGPDYADDSKSPKTWAHERRHAFQCLVFGPFQWLMYAVFVVLMYPFMKDRHPYYDNWFEWDARKAAGQPLDIKWQEWANSEHRWIWW